MQPLHFQLIILCNTFYQFTMLIGSNDADSFVLIYFIDWDCFMPYYIEPNHRLDDYKLLQTHTHTDETDSRRISIETQ